MSPRTTTALKPKNSILVIHSESPSHSQTPPRESAPTITLEQTHPSHRESRIVNPVPRDTPQRASLPSTCNGAMLMFSLPPHTTTFASPSRIDLAPCITVSNPEPQSRLIVSAGDDIGTPHFNPTCLARYAASELDCMTFPK